MKIVQIENGFVHWDATKDVPDLEWAKTHYASNIVFVEAPDYVFEGMAYDETLEGDERFVKPTPPEGWYFDEETGTFKPEHKDETEEDDPLIDLFSDVLDQI